MQTMRCVIQSLLMHMLQVNEPAGTYLWHDHSSQLRADGLQGALIVHARGGQAAEPWTYDREQTLLISDWFHGMESSVPVFVSAINIHSWTGRFACMQSWY